MTDQDMENCYRESLEESIIFCLAERRNISYEAAMELYYNSRVAQLVYDGTYGIQYLDYSILADIVEQDDKEKNGIGSHTKQGN